MAITEAGEARGKALSLLARREHTRYELTQKLLARDYPEVLVDEVLQTLIAEGLLSDERATELIIRQRANKGCGELKIRAELYRKGVDGDCVNRYLAAAGIDWWEVARAALEKKFAHCGAVNQKMLMKQQRFLSGRGFPAEIVGELLRKRTPEY